MKFFDLELGGLGSMEVRYNGKVAVELASDCGHYYYSHGHRPEACLKEKGEAKDVAHFRKKEYCEINKTRGY